MSKNPIEYLKHIIKDPVKTIDDINDRKKEMMPLLYVSIGLAVVPTVLMTVLDLGFMGIFSFIGIVGLMLCGFLFMVLSKAKTRFQAFTCDGCGHLLDIDTMEQFKQYVSYEIVHEKTHSQLTHPSSNNGVVSMVKVSGGASALVNVAFTCPKCGKVKAFQYSVDHFKCQREEKNVRVADLELVKTKLENSMKEVIDLFNSPDRNKIPYTVQSIHHPNNANKAKPGTGRETYNGVTIVYRRDVDEMVEGLFIHNELNGSIKIPK